MGSPTCTILSQTDAAQAQICDRVEYRRDLLLRQCEHFLAILRIQDIALYSAFHVLRFVFHCQIECFYILYISSSSSCCLLDEYIVHCTAPCSSVAPSSGRLHEIAVKRRCNMVFSVQTTCCVLRCSTFFARRISEKGETAESTRCNLRRLFRYRIPTVNPNDFCKRCKGMLKGYWADEAKGCRCSRLQS